MKIAREIISLIFLTLLLIFIIILLTNYLNNLHLNSGFYEVLGPISTAVASVGGLLLLVVTFLYLLETRKMTIETIKQTEILGSPAVSIKIGPDNADLNMLYITLKNTGGGAAYDISVNFFPDLDYRGESLNKLNMFKNLPLLEKGEEIKFFFDSAIEYLKSNKLKETTAKVTYYKTPKININSQAIIRNININMEERMGQLQISKKDINDLVNEIEELKQVLLISTIEKKEEKNDRRNSRNSRLSNSSRKPYINSRFRSKGN